MHAKKVHAKKVQAKKVHSKVKYLYAGLLIS